MRHFVLPAIVLDDFSIQLCVLSPLYHTTLAVVTYNAQENVVLSEMRTRYWTLQIDAQQLPNRRTANLLCQAL